MNRRLNKSNTIDPKASTLTADEAERGTVNFFAEEDKSEALQYNEQSILHSQYLVSLLPPGSEPDEPYYAGDIYEEDLTPYARNWRNETYHSTYLPTKATADKRVEMTCPISTRSDELLLLFLT